jgi:hypothetical protein
MQASTGTLTKPPEEDFWLHSASPKMPKQRSIGRLTVGCACIINVLAAWPYFRLPYEYRLLNLTETCLRAATPKAATPALNFIVVFNESLL